MAEVLPFLKNGGLNQKDAESVMNSFCDMAIASEWSEDDFKQNIKYLLNGFQHTDSPGFESDLRVRLNEIVNRTNTQTSNSPSQSNLYPDLSELKRLNELGEKSGVKDDTAPSPTISSQIFASIEAAEALNTDAETEFQQEQSSYFTTKFREDCLDILHYIGVDKNASQKLIAGLHSKAVSENWTQNEFVDHFKGVVGIQKVMKKYRAKMTEKSLAIALEIIEKSTEDEPEYVLELFFEHSAARGLSFKNMSDELFLFLNGLKSKKTGQFDKGKNTNAKELKDAFQKLGFNINNPPTKDTVDKAFRKLSFKHHPDKGGSIEEFQKMQKAHLILKAWFGRKL